MGFIEECDENYDGGKCGSCKKETSTKCSGCKKVYYCSKQCHQNDWLYHKGDCLKEAYKIQHSETLGKYIVANKDLKEGDILWTEAPLSHGPSYDTLPVCLNCYAPVNGSFKCRKSGWPLCGPKCEEGVTKNPEVVIPHQTNAEFIIESYDSSCYLYDTIAPLRILLMQKTAPKRYAKILSLESHFEERKNATPPTAWNRASSNVLDVMKKTLGLMVFEALYRQFDFSDETIQRISGILETNAIEIRLADSEIQALYRLTCLLEHSCCPNIKMTFDDKFNVTVRAGRNIQAGEHLSFMYTHSLWGTMARREHLYLNKFFWCKCPRCSDPTEYGSNLSTLIREGKELLQRKPLVPDCPWSSSDESVVISADEVKSEMTTIGAELALLQLNGTVDDYIQFIDKYEIFMHPNHYHLVTAKHSLLQMLGRSEGHLIQDLPPNMLTLKEDLCRQIIDVCNLVDPSCVRLQIYSAVALYELHLPLLQVLKRKWENGELPTEEFRKELIEPRHFVVQALDLLKDELNENLPEGIMRITVKETLNQLDQFMKSVGCEEA